MRIGFVQFEPALCNLERTLERLAPLLDRAGEAALIVLPELCNSGYNFPDAASALAGSEPVEDSRFLDFLTERCRRNSGYIVTGFNERVGDRLYNSAVLLGAEGPQGVYRKIHLFGREKEFFLPGDAGLGVFDLGGARIGMLVCFDWIYPEVWRVQAIKGADIICHPSNLVLPGLAQRAVPIRALENRVFVITANRIGTEGDLRFTGRSLVSDTRGQVLTQGPEAEPAVCLVEIDPAAARDKSVTDRNNLLADRRPEQYSLLVEQPELS